MSLDLRALRDALGQYPTGVAVVTACVDRAKLGLTMNSFAAVSLDPPLVLFSVARAAHSLKPLEAAAGFAINILGRDQALHAERFAKAQANKWSEVAHTTGLADAPILPGAAAVLECAPFARHDGGDHVIFVVRVVRFAIAAGRTPLVFHRGGYTALDSGVQNAAGWPLGMHY
jgi:flavin reductase (DIM6/NTAB) family NADH-FMN oxidoreductase RutF